MIAGGFVLVSLGCGPPPPQAVTGALAGWFEAIHERDYERLARYDGSAPSDRSRMEEQMPPTAFDEWVAGVEAALAAWERDRDRGVLDPDPGGYALVRATLLGRGVFWQVGDRREADGGFDVEIKLNFGYGEIPYGTLPAGSTVYLLGYPLGTVYPIVLGEGQEHELDLLEHAWVTARLVEPAGEPVPGDSPLKVRSLAWSTREPEHERVRWIF
jgi:hypothetical protein